MDFVGGEKVPPSLLSWYIYQISDIYQIFIRYLSDIYQMFIRYLSNIYQIFIKYLSDIYQIFIKYLSDIYQIFIRYLSDIFIYLSAVLKVYSSQLLDTQPNFSFVCCYSSSSYCLFFWCPLHNNLPHKLRCPKKKTGYSCNENYELVLKI